jgi:hypothetical protein
MSLGNITKIVTAGDGFAANHIWPMWPHILQMTTVDTEVTSLGAIGAGNEYIFNSVLNCINNVIPDLVIVQWAQSNRLDLILDTDHKIEIAKVDPVYNENIYNNWWLSSASTQPYVKTYHCDYISGTQSKLRTKNYIISLTAILEKRNIPYLFSTTYASEHYPDNNINWDKWVWHQPGQGMQEYSLLPRFNDIRLTEVQPSPLVHMQWVLDVLRPNLAVEWSAEHIEKLQELFARGDCHGLLPHYCARSK